MQAWRKRLTTLRPTTSFDYEYMKAGKKSPDRMPKLLRAHGDALDQLGLDASKVILAGKSMGSRVGCHLSLERKVAALVCFGYPLVGRKDIRDEVLRKLTVPILFVQGSKDKLCPLEQLEAVRRTMATRSALHVVEGGNHSLEVGKRQLKADGKTQDDIDDQIQAAVEAFVDSL